MLGLSQRAQAMPPSPIRKLAPFAAGARARGIEIFHLNIGQPDVPSPEGFWKAVRETPLQVLEYSPSDGLPELKVKVASYYRSIGIEVGPENVIVTTAGSEALSFALLCCLGEDDEVIIPEPLYANYIGFATAAGVKVRALRTYLDDDFRLPSIEDFESAITPRTKAILVCNPGNPTGAVYTDDQVQALRDLCIKHNLYLIGDEVYRDFNYTDEPVRSVLTLEGMEEHAIMVDSVSKRFSLCGARIGFLVTRNRAIFDAALCMAQARLSPPTLEQIGVISALDTPASYFHDVREEFRRRRDTLVRRLRAMPGVKVPQINGAFYATVRLPIDDSDKYCQWLLESFDLNGRTVMLAPATGFYSTPGAGLDEVRIAYVLREERLEQAMDVLEASLVAYPGRRMPVGGVA